MRRYKLILITVVMLCAAYTHAMNTTELHRLYDTGQHQKAITQTMDYLHSYPNDGDVRLVLAQFYFQEQQYQQARLELLTILAQTPTNTDAFLVLINCDIALRNDQEALLVANLGRLFNPFDTDLYKKQFDVTTLMASITPPYQVGYTPSSPVPESRLVAIELPEATALPNSMDYKRIKALYAQGQHQLAIQQAQQHLVLYPKDVDVRLILGQFYFLKKRYQEAVQQEKHVLQQVPNYKDAMFILINAYMQLKQFDRAKTVVKQGLAYYPDDMLLRKKMHDIQTIQNPPPKKSAPYPDKKPEAPKYLNEIGLYQQNYYASDVRQLWDYSTLFYAREGELGKIYAKVNYNQRLDFRAVQEEIEAFPKLTKNIYLDIQAAIANEPNLFPDRLIGGELYVSIPKIFDVSGGGKYNFIDSLHQFTLYTGSLAKLYHNKHRLTYRANFYDPSSGKTSLLHLFDYRYFIQDPNVYVGIMYGQGTSPDLANLVTVDFLVTDNKIVSPYLNMTFLNERLILNAALYYQNQVFFSLQRIRNWTGGTLRLAWKY